MTEVLRKKANAKIHGAQGRGPGLEITEAMDALMGGTWVGGEVVLSDDSLVFEANLANKLIQQGDLDVRFALTEVRSVEIAGGVGTKIVQVDLVDGSQFLFRCFGAKAVVETLRAQLP